MKPQKLRLVIDSANPGVELETMRGWNGDCSKYGGCWELLPLPEAMPEVRESSRIGWGGSWV